MTQHASSLDAPLGWGTVASAVLELRDVSYTYLGPPAVTALQPCSLDVRSGEYLAVMGPSGAGKSTLLNIMGLLDAPTSGRVAFEGTDVTTLRDSARTALRGRRIGFVFQSFHLLPYRTAAENVAIGMLYAGVPQRERRARAPRALAAVGVAHRAAALPTQLSGGERQRVAIARALAIEPALLLCDEPTGNLDSANAEKILELLDELHERGHTIVTVTHNAIVAQRAGRVVVVEDGLITDPPRTGETP